MEILLTGATGFVGSHILEELLDTGHRVSIITRNSSDLYRIRHRLDEVAQVYKVDQESLESILQKQQVEVIIHTATSYGRNQLLSEQLEANIHFPVRLLELGERYQAKAFINTDTFFGKEQHNSYAYLDSYTKSKKFMDSMAKAYAASHSIKYVNMRLEHVYGPKDQENKFISAVMKSLLQESSLQLTPGEQKRDFIFVKDVAKAYTTVLEHLQTLPDEIEFEIGRGESVSIREFVELAHQLTASSTNLDFGMLPYRESEIMDSFADHKNLLTLGWEAETDLFAGILATIESLVGAKQHQ